MKKTEKRTYLSPETEVVRFSDDIITTSPPTGENVTPPDIDGPESQSLLNEPF